MGLLAGWLGRWSLKAQKRDMQTFIDALSSMDSQEIGLIVAIATHMRNNLEELGYRLMDPLVDYQLDPAVTLRLGRLIKECQKLNQPTDAAGTMVWLHTMRVGGQHELRPQAREMWRQLGRGFPHAEDAAFEILKMTLKPPRIEGFDRYPAGLTPDPL